MQSCGLNDEEKAILKDFEGLPEPELIGILEDSVAGEPEESGRRVLRTLLSKLKDGRRPTPC